MRRFRGTLAPGTPPAPQGGVLLDLGREMEEVLEPSRGLVDSAGLSEAGRRVSDEEAGVLELLEGLDGLGLGVVLGDGPRSVRNGSDVESLDCWVRLEELVVPVAGDRKGCMVPKRELRREGMVQRSRSSWTTGW